MILASVRRRVQHSLLGSSLLVGLIMAVVASAGLRPSRALPYVQRDVPMSVIEAALIGALPLLATFCALRFVAGPLAARFNRRKAIAGLVLGLAVVQVLQGAALNAG